MTEYKEALDRKRRRKYTVTIAVIVVAFIIVVVLMKVLFQGRLEALRTADAKMVMGEIYVAANKFYKDNGKWPNNLNELEEQGYWLVTEEMDELWTFYLIGDKNIRAISTQYMPGGKGRLFDYSFATGKFTGYGCPEEGEDANFNLLIE